MNIRNDVTVGEVLDTCTDEQKNFFYEMVGCALSNDELSDERLEYLNRIYETLSKTQKKVLYALIGLAVDDDPKSKKKALDFLKRRENKSEPF